MPLFACSIRGENFPGAMIGESAPIGFYTTRYVEAASSAAAETAALETLREEPVFNVPASARSKDAKVYFDEISEVPSDTPQIAGAGFSFFIMGT